MAVLLVTLFMAKQGESNSRNRAAAEAASLAEHSGMLATGDAFAGYIHMLRVADDAEVRTLSLASDQRTAAMRRLLELNTNRFFGYAVVDLDGEVVAATDLTLLNSPASEAYVTVRASHGNANSDIVFADGAEPYVDYATILTDPLGGAWAVLVARAQVDRLWQPTLSASVDGGKNIVISRDGLMATGVPVDKAGTPWRGTAFTRGAIRTDVAGTDSVCGLHAIAAETKIDHGWNVASCLPAGTVLVGGPGWLKTGLFVGVALLLVTTVVGAMLCLAAREQPSTLQTERVPAETPFRAPEAGPQPEPVVVTVTNVEAQTVIDAYEARNSRLATRIRESVQARLLVVSSRVEEAIQSFEDDPELARSVLEGAAHELDDLNEHELRAIGQELYPDLVRLGLPAALRALKKDIADVLDVEVDADAEADSVDESSKRAIDTPRRLALYRAALESLRSFAEAGLETSSVKLRRGPESIWLAMKAHGHTGAPEHLAGSIVAIETYGGTLTIDIADDSLEIVAEMPAQTIQMEDPASPRDSESVVAEVAEADGPEDPDSEAA